MSITVDAVDDPPVTTASGTLAYTENDAATAIAPALTVTDSDSANLTGATVQISAGYENGADVLDLPSPPAGISSAFNAATGTLTLSGTATVAAYEAALRAVTYENTSDDPSSSPRTVTFKARDAVGFGPAATRTITVAPVNDAPAITTSAGPLSYTENDPATAIDGGLVLTDPDSQITGATVQITGNHASPEDVLALASPPAGITPSYDSGDRHADAQRHRDRRRLPGRAARRDVPQHVEQPEHRDAHRDVPRQRRVDDVGAGDARDQRQRRPTTRPTSTTRPARSPTPRTTPPRRSTRRSRSPTSTRRTSPARPSRSPATTPRARTCSRCRRSRTSRRRRSTHRPAA